ncbi:MAG: hypothetical protein V2A58_14455 [Planctomycetota bacterium]
MIRFFLAGIIQGSIPESRIHSQDYREEIKCAIRGAVGDAQIYCPIENHPRSLDYADDRARSVFFDLMTRAADTDVLVAFLPEASMGTAIEMWQAHRAGALVLAVSPLSVNWVVRFLADRVFPTFEDLETFLRNDEFRQLLADKGPPAHPEAHRHA